MEIVLIILALFIYFLPSLVGGQKKNAGAIFLLNLLLGWTLIGWVVALVWAASNDSNDNIWECDFCGHKQRENFEICPECKKDSKGLTEEENRETRIRKEIEDEIIREKIRAEINSKKD